MTEMEERARYLLQAAAETVDVGPEPDPVVRRRPVWPMVAAAAVVVAGLISLPVLLWDSREEPSGPPSPAPSSIEPGTSGVSLGTRVLDDGRRIELIALTGGEWVDVEIRGVDERTRCCVPEPSGRVPAVTAAISAWAIAQRNASSPYELYGTTSADVTRVVVTANGTEQEATLLRVTDLDALERAGIQEPFGVFFAELPPGTTGRTVNAAAYDTGDELLGTGDYTSFREQPLRAMIGGRPQS